MKKEKIKEAIHLFVILGLGVPGTLYYSIYFYQLFGKKDIVGRNLCLIITGIFLWGITDVLYHYLVIMKEHGYLKEFKNIFSGLHEEKLKEKFKHSIVGHRFLIILKLKDSLSDISHEILTEIISASESRRAIFAKYFLSACVLLGLLGTFLGLLEIVGGTYLAIGRITKGQQLIESLHQPLSGMTLAFSTSIVGIVSSLTMGFAYLFLYQRQLSFITELEEFTQTTLIPSLSRSSGKVMEEILCEIKAIKNETAHLITSNSKSIQLMADSIKKSAGFLHDSARSLNEQVAGQITAMHDSAKSLNEQVAGQITAMHDSAKSLNEQIAGQIAAIHDSAKSLNEQAAGQIAAMHDSARSLNEQVAGQIASMLDSAISLNEQVRDQIKGLIKDESFYIQEWLKGVKDIAQEQIISTQSFLRHESEQSLLRQEAILKDAAGIERKASDDFISHWSTTLAETNQSLKDVLHEFSQCMEKEQNRQESMIVRINQIRHLVEETGHLIHSNQAEMEASLAMFVQGVDKIIENFCQRQGNENSQKAFLEKLEASLSLFHERAGSVLLEYIAKSRELLAGIMENQIYLNHELQKIEPPMTLERGR